jgi:tRNA dimethylallyltransferase
MLADGFIDEVKTLVQKYPELTADSTSMRCVGYRQALEYLAGQYDKNELRDRGIFATRQLAKRQLTWLRAMDDIVEIDCLSPNLHELVLHEIAAFIKG